MRIICVASGSGSRSGTSARDDGNNLQLPTLATEEGREAAPIDLEMEMALSNCGTWWSDLPRDMLVKILDISGDCSVNCLALRSVCGLWHKIIPPPTNILSPFLPVKVPSLISSDQHWLSESLTDCVVAASSICLVRAPVEASSSSGSGSGAIFFLIVGEFVGKKLWLQNPMSKSLVSEMPYYLPDFVNLMDLGILQVGKSCSLISVPFDYKSLPPFKLYKAIIKAVMFSNGRAVVALAATGKLMMLNFGEESSWKVLDISMDYKFDDIVDFESKVFGVSRLGLVCAIDCDGTTNILGVPIPDCGDKRKRLVESSGELYVIVVEIPGSLKVHKLRLDKPSWVQVCSIGDAMFFVGYDLSFSISTQGLGGSIGEKRSTIVYTDESFPSYSEMDLQPRPKGEKDVLELNVFHLEATQEGDDPQVPSISSADYTTMFWPPPIWLQPTAM